MVSSKKEGGQTERPRVVCLCGSIRFIDTFQEAYVQESMKGKVVLTVSGDLRDKPYYERVKPTLEFLYRRKIDMADEILVLNVGGYIGKSTRAQIAYAKTLGKEVRFWEHGVPVWRQLLSTIEKEET